MSAAPGAVAGGAGTQAAVGRPRCKTDGLVQEVASQTALLRAKITVRRTRILRKASSSGSRAGAGCWGPGWLLRALVAVDKPPVPPGVAGLHLHVDREE